MKSARLSAALVALVVIIGDQISKALILAYLKAPLAVAPFFNLVLVWNKGISFGLLNDHDGRSGVLLLVAMSLVITAALIVWAWRTQSRFLALALGAAIGGALGNVIDRIRFGAVVDFLDFHAFGGHWPAFNIADSCIVVGIAFVAIDGLFFEPKEKNTEHAQS